MSTTVYDALMRDGKNRREAVDAAKAAEPFAWVQHHKGGDNLEWDCPGGKCSALFTEMQMAAAKAAVREAVAEWLDGQGQPGYAHEVRHRDWA